MPFIDKHTKVERPFVERCITPRNGQPSYTVDDYPRYPEEIGLAFGQSTIFEHDGCNVTATGAVLVRHVTDDCPSCGGSESGGASCADSFHARWWNSREERGRLPANYIRFITRPSLVIA